MNIIFPWPPKELSPNSRCHFMKKAKFLKSYRQDCAWITTCAKTAAGFPAFGDAIKVSMEFCPPDKRKRDLDNVLASCKALLDGIALAIGEDDSKFHLSLKFSDGKPGTVAVSVE